MKKSTKELVAAVLRAYVSRLMAERFILHLDNNDPYQAALIDMNKEAERLVPTIITNRPS